MPAERTVLVSVELDPRFTRDRAAWSLEDEAKELRELAVSSGCQVQAEVTARRHQPIAGTFLGSGKLHEIHDTVHRLGSSVVIFNHELSPAQQRNIEETLGVKTIDRTQLILDIFAQRAKSQEGQVQVELAQLQYLLPRLTGQGVMLSRQAGGIGARGPGEQKLEVDRRRIRLRIGRLKDDLEKLAARRAATRSRRKETQVPIAALVGYTNAGKTTLLNRLTGAGAAARHQLFTTLDPLARRLRLPDGEHIIITDTVGFLHHLPHHLIEAFHATLEEALDATVLLHVLDASHKRMNDHAKAVEEVLTSLQLGSQPVITVLNKCDQVTPERPLQALENAYRPSAAISAKTGQGIDRLLECLQQQLALLIVPPVRLRIRLDQPELAALVYQSGQVLQRRQSAEATELLARIPERLKTRLADCVVA